VEDGGELNFNARLEAIEMNIEQTPEQKIQMLEAQVLDLENKLSDAETSIEELKAEVYSLEDEIKDLDDYSDGEIRDEFLSRGMTDPMSVEYERLADHIARGETDDALSLLADISEGSVSPAVAKMLVKAHAQESLL
jgi:chromosome segregation ATPase